MSHVRAFGQRLRNRVMTGLVVAMTATASVAAIGWWCALGGGGGTIRVDFDGVVPATANPTRGDSRPLVRAAVAAMISPKATKRYYEQLVRLIAGKVGRRAVFTQRKTYAEVNDLLERKDIDIASVCSGPNVTGHRKSGMAILAVPVAHGEKVYYCYFIVKRDSTFESLDDLVRKTFAFTDPNSSTGCLVPKYVLARRGCAAETFFSETFSSAIAMTIRFGPWPKAWPMEQPWIN